MYFTKSELMTIKLALIIYDKSLYKGLRNKGFFIDIKTLQIDIVNIHNIKNKIEIEEPE